MIYTANKKIKVNRLVESSWEKTYSDQIYLFIDAYIEPYQDEVWAWFDWQWAYNIFRMFSNDEILIWDKLTDQDEIVYKVKWCRKFESIVWKHYETIIQSIYD